MVSFVTKPVHKVNANLCVVFMEIRANSYIYMSNSNGRLIQKKTFSQHLARPACMEAVADASLSCLHGKGVQPPRREHPRLRNPLHARDGRVRTGAHSGAEGPHTSGDAPAARVRAAQPGTEESGPTARILEQNQHRFFLPLPSSWNHNS